VPCHEKIWFVIRPEFGSQQGTVVKVVRALHGLNLSGALWFAMFNATIIEMGFVSTVTDLDVHRKVNSMGDNFKYYKYILVYFDDVLIISHMLMEHLERIKTTYELNPSSIGPPSQYVGANIRKLTRPGDPTGHEYWSYSVNTYIKNAVRNAKLLLQEKGHGLKLTAKTPSPSTTYHPEVVDTTDKCDLEMALWYSQLIGVFHWAVELGRLNIYTGVSLLLQHLVLLRVGRLEVVYHVFA
jgi:hypothetical protein